MVTDILKQYIKINNEIKQLEEEIIRLKAKHNSPKSSTLSDIPLSNSKYKEDKIGSLMESIDKLYDKYIDKKTELYNLQYKIELAIENLSTTERQLLRWKYIKGLTWEQILEKIQYSIAQIHRIHNRAIAKIDESKLI